ncbi:Carbon catabolite repressor protein 4-like protein 6 [Raphanus sativus]|uniref:Carbon catabolite repressor protein 4 homolog 6 isoform X2 n=1 Tax=Raphanus sativus TaxID=3726 RepID=A0A6J0KD74_RAPSA|nr:carbon catabolite repressor protein 4 homolog 6 isoform X2 [Raphanus sativus]KAJ4883029.1 Carbon catabolite repressor protein 4-like protein 6 [Raphanus sativus]
MWRSRFQVFSEAAISNASTTCAPIVAMSSHPLYRGGRARGRGRGRGGRSFSDRPYNDAGGRGGQFVTGDSHFQSVHDANLEFRHGFRGSSNLDPRRFDHVQQPPFNRSYEFRPPPPQVQWRPNHPPSGQSYSACPPPQFYQNQMSRPPPPQQRSSFRPQRPRSKHSDYREWEYAKTAPSPGSEKFIVLSYNILADYLAIDHWKNLYFHIPRSMLSWGWRKSKIVFELGLWSADIMCLQEVDKFQDLEEDLRHRGYSGIWKMRTGNAVDGCAIFWRSNRFKLVHEESIQFNQLGLRDNVAQICVLEALLNSDAKENEASPSESCSRRVVVCNIHVLYNPKRGDFKLGQVRTLLERAHAVSKLWDDAPVVLCGDFNCTPKSHLYNFISEGKLDLSGLARNKVSGQESAEIRPPRPEIYTRPQSANKSPQGQVQPQDSIGNAPMENNFNMDVGKAPSIRNTSEIPCGDTVIAGHKATSSSERVLLGEDLHSGCTLEGQNRKPDDAGDLSIAECLSSVTITDPEPPHTSNGKDDSQEKLSASSVISETEHSPEEIVSNAQSDSSSLSTKVDTSAEMKLDDLTLDEADVLAQEEGIGEDGESFLAKLHDSNEDSSQSGELVNVFSRESGSAAFDNGKITYNPASWTPMEIAAATGDPERSTVEHALELKSAYSEIEGKANTRDENGEPVVTSYHRCFMGTVDYIWRSEGLQTVRVLAPIPKQAMQWTPGFPTPKWGSDHIALVSELAFCSSEGQPKS